MSGKESWKHELDVKYNQFMNSGDIKLIDKANEVILNAIAKLDEIRRIERLRGGSWQERA